MAMTAADYLAQLQALLPHGPAWPTESDAATTQILTGLAQEFARVDNRIDALLEEADPRTTYEMLTDWERVVGYLACRTAPASLLSQRRAELTAKLTGLGGQTPQYFINLLASIGYTITITEFQPWTVDQPISEITGTDWAYAFQINAPVDTIKTWTVTDGVDEQLSVWGNALLECLINLYKPAHTISLFSYT